MFKTTQDSDRRLRMPSFVVKGHPAAVSCIRKAARRLRVFYLPFYVPITTITDQLERDGVKIKKYFQDKDRETGLLSNVWNLLVEIDNPDLIPDRMRWSFAGVVGSVLVNMAGRLQKCLRCQERGHRKFECMAPYCHLCRKVGHAESDACPTQTYAALVRRPQPADEDAMDEPCEETAELQLSTNRSWAEQIDEQDQHAAPSGARPSTEAPVEAAAESTAERATTQRRRRSQRHSRRRGRRRSPSRRRTRWRQPTTRRMTTEVGRRRSVASDTTPPRLRDELGRRGQACPPRR